MHCTSPNVMAQRAFGNEFVCSYKNFMSRRLKYEPGKHFLVGCKQCVWCRLNRSREVAARIVHEMKAHRESWFFTLTYDDEHLPQSCCGPTLDRPRITRLRKDIDQDASRGFFEKFKVFVVGEYGDKKGRPHYHGVAFVDYPWQVIEVEKSRSGAQQFVSAEMTRLWPEGAHRLSKLNFEFAAYAARYALKKQTGKNARRYGGKTPEFSSWCHGLGSAHFERFRSDMYPSDECVVTRANGDRVTMLPPTLYDRWLEKEDPELLQKVRDKRLESRDVFTEAEWFGLNQKQNYDRGVGRTLQRRVTRKDL